jgi:hypothetical protein
MFVRKTVMYSFLLPRSALFHFEKFNGEFQNYSTVLQWQLQRIPSSHQLKKLLSLGSRTRPAFHQILFAHKCFTLSPASPKESVGVFAQTKFHLTKPSFDCLDVDSLALKKHKLDV